MQIFVIALLLHYGCCENTLLLKRAGNSSLYRIKNILGFINEIGYRYNEVFLLVEKFY